MKNAVKVTPEHEEEHIVSVIVHVNSQHRAAVEQTMNRLKGVELVTQNEHGKYVLLVSAATARDVIVQIESIQDLNGVLSAAMIAHHTESPETLNESIDYPDGLQLQAAE